MIYTTREVKIFFDLRKFRFTSIVCVYTSSRVQIYICNECTLQAYRNIQSITLTSRDTCLSKNKREDNMMHLRSC